MDVFNHDPVSLANTALAQYYGSYTDGAMMERLLPSCIQGYVAASLQHVVPSLFRGGDAKVP